jgi:uncharacterized membrane protein YesL
MPTADRDSPVGVSVSGVAGWGSGEVGRGFLAEGSALVYRCLVLHLFCMLAVAPGLVVLVLVTPDVSNAPLLGLALVPVAPALSASLFAWDHSSREDDLQPGRHFWAGYRANAGPVLVWWLPVVAVLTVLMVDLSHLGALASGRLLTVLSVTTVAAAAVVVVAAAYALVITSLFRVRTRDLVRLLPYYLRRPGLGVAALALVFSALGLAVVVSPWLLLVFPVPATMILLHFARPVVADIREHFVA